jgi:O-antigen/teichoic acid export membrane protein
VRSGSMELVCAHRIRSIFLPSTLANARTTPCQKPDVGSSEFNAPNDSQAGAPQVHGVRAYVGDSAASLVRAMVIALGSVLTAPFLVRSLSKPYYSAWVLALSIAGLVGIAESGASTAVVRFSASGNRDGISELLASALLGVSALAVVPLSIIGILATTTNVFFAKAPVALHSNIRTAVLLCCINAFLALWTSVISGYFTANHKVKVSAVVSTIVLTLGNVAMVGSAVTQHSLVALAVIFATIGVANIAGMLIAIRPYARLSAIMPWRATRSMTRRIARHCLATGWWNLAMLLISGIDLFVVSRIDFASVGAYGIALRLLGTAFTLLAAGLTPLMAVTARLHAKGDIEDVTKLFMQTSRLASTAMALVGGLLFALCPIVVRIFAGESYVAETTQILRVLLVANLIRNTGAVLGVVMVATGEHSKAYLPPAAEAVVNLCFSITLGHFYGAIGVAYGTLLGALTTLTLYVALIFPRFVAFRPSRRAFLKCAVLKPAAVFVPFALIALVDGFKSQLAAALISGACSGCFLLMSFSKNERNTARTIFGRLMRREHQSKMSK